MVKFPQYIKDNPEGCDKFVGKSQTILSHVIAEHIVSNDKLSDKEAMPRIIGIEGFWGSGKTNVIRLVERALKEKYNKCNKIGRYYFFEYNTWGNQEDLQRRSFLQQLTKELVDNKVLTKYVKINAEQGEETLNWLERVKRLFTKKLETTSETIPLYSAGAIISVLIVVLISFINSFNSDITSFLANILNRQENDIIIKIIIWVLPIISILILWAILFLVNRSKYNSKYLMALFQGKVESNICFESIYEEETSIVEFKKWMMEVSDNIDKCKYKKIVIVYDNMDRLSSDKVRQMWSSIHTFFAETSYKNIWVIIPYDKKNLSCIFNNTSNTNETSQNKDTLTQHFIDKVFPVTFSVPKPVLTDYRAIFDIFYVDAFGDIGKENKEMINSLYRFFNPQANIRGIIIFINNLVSLYKTREQFKNDIGLVNMAIYLLKNFDIHKGDNEANNILSGDYLGDLTKNGIIYNDDNLKAEIAALTYGVNIETAKQIPLLEYIRGCVSKKEGYDINRHKNEKNFYMILKEVYDIEDIVKLPNMIDVLHNLELKDVKECNLDIISNIWEAIALKLLMLPLHEQILPEHYKILLNELK